MSANTWDPCRVSPDPVAVLQAGDPVLRRRAEHCPADMELADLEVLVAKLRASLAEAGGVGLAAPQIGIPISVAIMEDPAKVAPEIAQARDRRPLPLTVLINPRIVASSDTESEFYEGCLSVTGWQATVRRPTSVTVEHEAMDRCLTTSSFSGWQARIACHEIDHLAGTLYLDRADTRSLTSQAEYEARWNTPTPDEARKRLGFGRFGCDSHGHPRP